MQAVVVFVRTWSVRLLVLMMVWGSAIFLWGSLEVWGEQKAVEDYRRTLLASDEDARAWAANLSVPVDKLASDARLLAALELPAGVTGVPAMRVLQEFAYQHHAQDVYLVDAEAGTYGMALGGTPLRKDLLARLQVLSGPRLLFVGAGERNGQIYVARKVETAFPVTVYAVVPFGLNKANIGRPDAGDEKQGLLLAHTSGWAWWPQGSARFSLYPETVQPGHRPQTVMEEGGGAAILIPLKGVDNAWLALRVDVLVGGINLLPQVLLFLWALTMTVLVCWPAMGKVREVVEGKAAPLVGALKEIGAKVRVPLARLSEHVGEKIFAAAETPLVDGPGDFLPGDFNRPGPSGGARPQPRRRLGRPERSHVSQADADPAEIEQLADDMRHNQEDREMKELIKRCVREGRLNLLYQPIFRMSDNRPVMHEIYTRLIRPDGEMVLPGQFLPVANKFGLMQALDGAVYAKVMQTHFASGMVPDTVLALNIGGTSLDGISYLQELVNHGTHVLQHLTFEVRSQEIVRDQRALRLLHDIQRHGGHLSVDYFGGGKAMLDASQAMGFDYVKLDASRFTDEQGKAELPALVSAAREVKLPVILEKVEDEEMENFARRNGVVLIQGYGLAKPSSTLVMAPLNRPVVPQGQPPAPVAEQVAAAAPVAEGSQEAAAGEGLPAQTPAK